MSAGVGSGTVNRKIEPTPGSLSAPMCPPSIPPIVCKSPIPTSPSIFSGRGTVGLDERLKQFAEGAGSNAYPVIDYGKPDVSHR